MYGACDLQCALCDYTIWLYCVHGFVLLADALYNMCVYVCKYVLCVCTYVRTSVYYDIVCIYAYVCFKVPSTLSTAIIYIQYPIQIRVEFHRLI